MHRRAFEPPDKRSLAAAARVAAPTAAKALTAFDTVITAVGDTIRTADLTRTPVAR